METVKIGVREFRDKLATYLLESEAPLAITRHGDTIGTSSLPGGRAARQREQLSGRLLSGGRRSLQRRVSPKKR